MMKPDLQKYYLLQDSEETRQMALRLRELLESQEEGNIQLAFQLMQGGGVPESLRTCIYLIGLWHDHPQVRKQARKLFAKFSQEKTVEVLKTVEKQVYKKYDKYISERKMHQVLLALADTEQLDRNDIGNFTMRITGKAGKFCLHYKTAPVREILKPLIKNNQLSLFHFDLEELPEEVGTFPSLIMLDLRGNRFKTLPDSLAALRNVSSVHYHEAELPQSEIRKLEQWMPLAFYYVWCREADQAYYRHSNFEKAIELYTKGLNAYASLGKSIKDVLILYRRAECLTKLGRYEEAAANYTIAIEHNPNDAFALNNRAYKQMQLARYGQAFADSNRAIELEPTGFHYGTRAEIFATQGDIDAFYHHLEVALQKGFELRRFINDAVYQPFVTEPRFMALLEQYCPE